jgi:hypothetical protein
MINLKSRTELLIQRCIDDELSAIETKRLLDELDEVSDGWKSLACGLLEDRQLRKFLPAERPFAMVVASEQPVADTVVALSRGSAISSAVRTRQWWAHPLTTLSLCLAIAVLGGLLLSDQQAPLVAKLEAVNAQPSAPAFPVGEQKVTLESPAGTQMNFPIYQRLPELLKAEPNHPFRQMLEDGRPLRLLMVPDSSGRTILVPIPEAPSRSLQ